LSDTVSARIEAKLAELYGPARATPLLNQLNDLVVNHPITPRPIALSERDVILIAYGDHLRRPSEAPLHTLHSFCKKYLLDTVSAVHILPFYPYTSDDGFSVVDYRAVNPDLGTWRDVRAFAADFRLMFDLVLNHASVSCAWFEGFLANNPIYRDYFVTADPDKDGQALSQVVRPRTHPLLTPFTAIDGTIRYVWTTFSPDQVDLNFANPSVLLKFIEIVLYYVAQGADFLRLDAIAYLWKQVGTSCIHLPQTHRVVQLLRDVLDAAAPWVQIITETNVPHPENVSYFGDGTNEAQMVYNFTLPPLVVHALQTGDASRLFAWAGTLFTPSPQTTFFNFTASHDGIGLRPATGLLSDVAIAAMIERVIANGGHVNYKANTDGTPSPYEMNITYFDALSAPDDTQTLAIDRFICSQAIMLAMPGVPGIYLPSLLGSRNWREGVAQTGHNRAINREKLDADAVERALADESSQRSQVFSRYLKLLRTRTTHAAFHPNAPARVFDYGPQVFAVARVSPDNRQRVMAIHNVTPERVEVNWTPSTPLRDLFTGEAFAGWLMPYQVAWLSAD
jgi:sucrose phosphorylase